MPSDTKPSTDHVFTNTCCGLGKLATCVSRSAMWISLDAESLRQRGPFLARLRLGRSIAKIGGEIHQRAFDEPRDHAGIRAAAGHGVVPPGLRRRASRTRSRNA